MLIQDYPTLKEVEKHMTTKKKIAVAKKKPPVLKDGAQYVVLLDGEQQYWSDPDRAFSWDHDDDDYVAVMDHSQAVTVVKQLAEENKDVEADQRPKIEVFKVIRVDLKIVYPEQEPTVTLGK